MRQTSTITGLLYCGVVLVLCLLAYEVIYFSILTGAALKEDQYSEWQPTHDGCKAHPAEPADFTCPLSAYNWVEVECWTSMCLYRDPNSPTMTVQRQQKREQDLKQDLEASLYTVPLVSREQAQKALREAATRENEPQAGDLDHVEDLSARELKRFQDIARMGHP